ncbi:MAG: hypothetical protein LBR87_02180 [Synergistaceae bacterium]|jgi:2'-hydroxybiphenyl-2-sulfinate desulfinase|nr:hypothetical protein [Synergistaceae bacterium]
MSEIKEIHFTICPVANTSYIAHKKGWIREALEYLDVKPLQLQDLSKELWQTHFDYKNPLLFREGGNAPPIYAKADGQDLILLGVTLVEHVQYIIVRADSRIGTIEQLAGKKAGIPSRPDAIIDFQRVSSQQAFDLALSARGVNPSRVEYADITAEGNFVGGFKSLKEPGSPPEERRHVPAPEVDALDEGRVDAVYVRGGRAVQLLASGKYRVIFDLAAAPDVLSPINNEYPNVLTVHRNVAEKAPEVVVAYIKQLLRAAEWAAENYAETVELLAEQTYTTPGEFVLSHKRGYTARLAPELSEHSLRILEGRKEALLRHGYLKGDFDVIKWADDSFLRQARKELQA